ncbi:MAG: GTPase ObgE [Eubacteriales bacterium]|nr:GTPase ObgE [Eubacteriales bacterium]
MFIDSAKIFIKSGKGGDGCVSFRRELYVPNGGPDGGDGGNGGDIIFVIDKSLNTLESFRHQTKYIAESGEDGQNKKCKGKNGNNLIIKVPNGTIIRDYNSGKIIHDMTETNDTYTILKGGRGGAGNQHFVTSIMQAPKYAKKGSKSQELYITLELKLLADVALVGFPNVGKSTIISKVSNAKVQIANYHFTTINPHLGVVNINGVKPFVIVDIPGLIENAHKGDGLGISFLKHIERTKIILHIVDISGLEGRDPLNDIKIINNELEKYNINFSPKNMVFAFNKSELVSKETIDNYVKEISLQYKDYKYFIISAIQNKGIKELMQYLSLLLNNFSDKINIFKEEIDLNYELKEKENELIIEKINDHTYKITGEKIEKMLGYTNIDTEKGFLFLQNYLEKEGIINKLKQLGLKENDDIEIIDYSFKYYE